MGTFETLNGKQRQDGDQRKNKLDEKVLFREATPRSLVLIKARQFQLRGSSGDTLLCSQIELGRNTFTVRHRARETGLVKPR